MSSRNTTGFSRLSAFIALAFLCLLALLVSLLALPSPAAAASYMQPNPSGLSVSPTAFTSNCRTCNVTLSNNSPKTITWIARSQGIAGITVTPSFGTLPAHSQRNVVITIPGNITCPAQATITFIPISGQNSATVSWSCTATPTPTPRPSPTPSPTPTPAPTLGANTPTVGPTPSATATPTVSSGGGTGQQQNGNPPSSDNGSSAGSSALSILFTFAGLLLGTLAFLLYLIPPAHTSLRTRLLSLIMPVSIARRFEQEQ